MVGVAIVIGKDRIRQDNAQKEPGPIGPRDKIGVLALPAEAGSGAQRFFHDRRRVDKHFHVSTQRLRKGLPPRASGASS